MLSINRTIGRDLYLTESATDVIAVGRRRSQGEARDLRPIIYLKINAMKTRSRWG